MKFQGGFLKGDSYIVLGSPSAGKTFFSHQVAFNHIANSGRVIYLTVLARSPRPDDWRSALALLFNLDALNDSFFYISGYNVLEKEGLKGLSGLDT